MSRLATRSPGPPTRTAEQILTELRDLHRTWAESRPDGVCDVLLDQLTAIRITEEPKP